MCCRWDSLELLGPAAQPMWSALEGSDEAARPSHAKSEYDEREPLAD